VSERLALALAALKRIEKKQRPFPQQDAFVNDSSLDIAALCTRRAGKTSGFARRFKKTMEKYPGCLCRYFALTRDSAKDIMWPILEELNEREGWGASFTESNLTMTLPNGSRLRLYGADMKNFRRRIRGAKSPANAIDEAQEFNSAELEDLIDNIIKPSTADYVDGWVGIGGTPGPIPRGYFHEITEKNLHGFSVHKWSLFDNPHMPNPKGFVMKLKEKKKWPDNHPSLLREYYGKWELDLDSLLIRYNQQINNYDFLPSGNWNYILGVDIGHKDADALAVIAWSEFNKDVYLVEELITKGQDITELSNQIESIMQRYEISKIVMDEGALGKKIAEEIRRRKKLPVHPADKARKMENVAFLNESLRLGRFKAKASSRFVSDSMQVQIDHDKSTPDKTVIKKGFHSDIIDAVLYAFKESLAFNSEAQEENPKEGTKEWAKREEKKIIEQLQEELNDKKEKEWWETV